MDKPTEKIRWTGRASAAAEAIARHLKRRNPDDAAAQIGRVWPAAMGEADLTKPLDSSDD